MLNTIFLFACDTTFAFTYMIMKVVKDPKFNLKNFFFILCQAHIVLI